MSRIVEVDSSTFRRKMAASNDPRPTHTVDCSKHPSVLTPGFDEKRAEIIARFEKYKSNLKLLRKKD